YDLNYRESLWSSIGGKEKAQQVNRRIAEYVDVMIGNEEDFTACLGYDVEGQDESLSKLDISSYEKMIRRVVSDYPNFAVIATTLRNAKTATINDWGAVCFTEGKLYQATMRENLEIYDRVGGGDSFASGLIYGLMSGESPEWAVNCGAAHGALAMTTPGDTTTVSLSDVLRVMKGKGARVSR
ncbi:MAG TPA: PfkB family carbohydrate kinase, partial [Pyrinomonadaceae bacterium]|nr:PfkB family carbohydrate kinase [Pyrinomonadaceae bacterium]